MEALESLRQKSADCHLCPLSEGRTRVVFGDGNPKGRIVLVGEAPGKDEDLSGIPFVGRAGLLLDNILASVGLSRREVFIINTVMCRPPGNRPPLPEEQAACRPFLLRKLETIQPAMVVSLGAVATKALLMDPEAAITRLRGQRIPMGSFYLYPTFHPAALLRDPAKKRPVWEDFKRIRTDYDLLVAGELTVEGGS